LTHREYSHQNVFYQMKKPVALLLSAVALLIVIVVAASVRHSANIREQAQWHRAEQTKEASVLRAFIAAYPSSEWISPANARLQLLEAREGFIKSENTDRCISFLKAYPKTEFTSEAMGRLEALCLNQAIADATNSSSATNRHTIHDTVSILEAAQKQSGVDVLTPEEISTGLKVLSSVRKYQQGFGVIRLQGIEPIGTTPVIVENALGASSFKMTGTITTGDDRYKLAFAGVIGAGNSAQALVVAGRGQMLVPGKSLESEGINVLAHQTVTMRGDTFLVSAELPGEYVLLEGGMGMSSSFTPKCPMGDGSIFRFRGEVRDFFTGVTFVGDDEFPLCFALLHNSGLTYLCGRGTIKTQDGAILQLPPPGMESGLLNPTPAVNKVIK
jgi:hypothetical protein